MWRWIVKRVKDGDRRSVGCLKLDYLRQERPGDNLWLSCYFCDFAYRGLAANCGKCPGKLVSRTFSCTAEAYNYEYRPSAFLHKLEQLNAKRKAEKAKAKP
jgi:hypothetical protein